MLDKLAIMQRIYGIIRQVMFVLIWKDECRISLHWILVDCGPEEEKKDLN